MQVAASSASKIRDSRVLDVNRQPQQWGVYPRFQWEDIYSNNPRMYDHPRTFDSEDSANDFLADPRNDYEWAGPVPVRELVTAGPRHSLSGQRFRDFLPAEDVPDSRRIDFKKRVRQSLEGRYPKSACLLGLSWNFEDVASEARRRVAYETKSRKLRPLGLHVRDVAVDLESAVLDTHGPLTAQAVSAFFTSWDLYLYLARFCALELAEHEDRPQVDLVEAARFNVWTQCGVYATQQAYLDDTRASTADDPYPSDLKWNEVSLRFTDDDHVQPTIRGKLGQPMSFATFGFEDQRGASGRPVLAWSMLRTLAKENGSIKQPAVASPDFARVQKWIQDLRKRLRRHFGIEGDPIPYDKEEKIYRAQFTVRFPNPDRF